MVEFNLLPWRDLARAYARKQSWNVICFSFLLTMICLGLIYKYLDWRVTEYESRIARLNNQLQQYQAKTHSQQAVTHLLGQRFPIEKLLTELGQPQSGEVCFSGIEQVKKEIHFKGMSRSVADLTAFLRHWSAAVLFSEVEVKSIEKQESGGMRFALVAKESESV